MQSTRSHTQQGCCSYSGEGVWIRAKDQLLAFVTGAHPRCGSRMAPPGAADALATSGCLIARLLWSFVTDTATDFVFGEWFTPSGWPRSRLHAFSVSPVLLGLTRDPQHAGPGKSTPGRGAVAWLGGSRWVEEVRSLDPPPPYLHQWFLCDSAGEERCLAERRPGFRRVPSAANHMWFVITTCDGVDGGGECTGTIGVVIMSLIGGDDPKADVSGVAVQIKECGWSGEGVDSMSFSQSSSNELLVVMSGRVPRESRFLIVDVGSTFQSKSLVILSDTACTFPTPGFLVGPVLPMKRRSGSRCFIVNGRVKAGRPPVHEIVEAEERSGAVSVLVDKKERPRAVYRVSDSLLCVTFGKGPHMYQLWDCGNGDATALVRSVPDEGNHFCVAVAGSGFIFTSGNKQVKVIEASSGAVVLCLPFPEICGFDGLWASMIHEKKQ